MTEDLRAKVCIFFSLFVNVRWNGGLVFSLILFLVCAVSTEQFAEGAKSTMGIPQTARDRCVGKRLDCVLGASQQSTTNLPWFWGKMKFIQVFHLLSLFLSLFHYIYHFKEFFYFFIYYFKKLKNIYYIFSPFIHIILINIQSL